MCGLKSSLHHHGGTTDNGSNPGEDGIAGDLGHASCARASRRRGGAGSTCRSRLGCRAPGELLQSGGDGDCAHECAQVGDGLHAAGGKGNGGAGGLVDAGLVQGRGADGGAGRDLAGDIGRSEPSDVCPPLRIKGHGESLQDSSFGLVKLKRRRALHDGEPGAEAALCLVLVGGTGQKIGRLGGRVHVNDGGEHGLGVEAG